jgi:hypothetical protein
MLMTISLPIIHENSQRFDADEKGIFPDRISDNHQVPANLSSIFSGLRAARSVVFSCEWPIRPIIFSGF